MSSQHPLPKDRVDIDDWHPNYQSCQRYFHEQAQHAEAVRAVAASVNIQLPFQRTGICTTSSSSSWSPLVPYVRRLVATGFDSPPILRGFFGDDWARGIGPIHENERRNYLFAAKSDTWLKVKASYDLADGQSIPFLRPLQGVTEKEIEAAESSWSEWLAMQDWMLGPRAPEGGNGNGSGSGSDSNSATICNSE